MAGLNWVEILFLLVGVCLCTVSSLETFQKKIIVNSSELSIIPITPQDFKWDKTPGSVNEILYSARISQYPDLPEWLHYTYESFSSVGYIYGVPPKRVQTMNLDVIGWNHYDNYDIRRLVVSMDVMTKDPLEFVVELKIDNLNVRDLCNSRRMESLLRILKEDLGWTQNDGNFVIPTFLASAVERGENRIPLRPNDAEGLIIHFSSDKDFSSELKKLQQEVASLWKMRPCPRDMKRTSVERHFRRNNFLVDWCSFRLTTVQHWNGEDDLIPQVQDVPEEEESSETLGENPELGDDENQSQHPKGTQPAKGQHQGVPDVFVFKTEIPERGYGMAALFACLIPGSIGGLVGFLLIALLWVDREDDAPIDEDTLCFEAAYRMLVSTFGFLRCRRQRTEDEDEWDIRPSDNIIIVTRPDDQYKDNYDDIMEERERNNSTPLPPQYGETHPNGTPALTYAV